MLANYEFDIEKSKDGFKILKIYKENKKIYIGSKYKMKESLDRFIDEDKDIQEESIVIFFGIGSGEYIKKFYNKFKNIKVIIFEPNVKLRNYINENVDEYDILKEKNIYLLNGEDTEEIYVELSQIIGEFNIRNILYRWVLNYDKIYINEMLGFNKVVKNFISDVAIARNTSIIHSKRWFYTLMSNFKYIIQSIPVNLLKNKYKGVPAIIVSAGPSLNKNINELSNINDDMMILTGGRTLKALIKKNIKPSLIGVVDPGELSYKLVEGYIEKTNEPLLFYEGTNEKIVKKHRGKKIFFTQNNTINKIFNMNIKNLGVGGSIAHTLTETAIFLGCNPIIFIGQDLAYTEEKYYADIAINECNNAIANEVDNIYVEDINGGKVRTDILLDNFRRELEKIIENNKNTIFINATEGGAKIKGSVQMKLKDAIKQYKKNISVEFCEELKQLDKHLIKNATIESLEQIVKADEKIIEESKKALTIVRNLKMYTVTNEIIKINKCLRELDNIDNVIKQKYDKLDILKSIMYPVIYTVLSSKKPKNDKNIIERNMYLYQSILNVSQEVLEPIKKVKDDIEKDVHLK